MGLVRVLLALAVVLTHAGLAFSVGGKLAVQLFYMISGFLMSYILVEKASYPTVGSFYFSRYLRLLPVYLVVLLITAAGYLVAQPEWYAKYGELPIGALILLFVSQASLFFMDLVMFTGVQDGQLHLVADYMNSKPPLFTALLVPQAWTLSLELAFYVIAPFILPKRRLIVGLLAASLVLRAILMVDGVGLNDPWTYRFFPTELALFLGGALSHQYLLPWARTVASHRRTQTCAVIVLACLVYSFMPLPEMMKEALMFAALAAALPLLLLFQDDHRWDSTIGNLSYPIYINHMLVLNGMELVLGRLGISGQVAVVTLSVIAVIVFAWLLDRYIAQPVDRWRHRLRKKSAPLGQHEPAQA